MLTRTLPPEWFIFAIFCFACLCQMLFGYYFFGQFGHSVGSDDGFISFRYARNLIDHGVLSFNANDAPRVEGFSNPLYVFVSAAVYAIVGADLLYWSMAILGGCAVVVGIIVIGRTIRTSSYPELAMPVMLAMAFCPPLWLHGTSGLETAFVFLFQALLWSLCIAPHTRGQTLSLILVCLALVTLRTDGFLFPFFAMLWLFWQGRWREAIIVATTTILVFVLQMGIRLAYYGLPMPLTFYVKVSGPLLERLEVSIRYLGSIALKNGLLLPLFGGVLAGLGYLGNVLSTRQLSAPPFELFCLGGLIAYYLYIGGDVYRDRFLIIAFPMGTVLLLRALTRHKTTFLVSGASLAIILWQFAAFYFDKRFEYHFELPKYDRFSQVGRTLLENHPGERVATAAAGKIPFYSTLDAIDMLGLNDRHIAMSAPKGANPGHNKFDADYIFAEAPDIICTHVFDKGSMAYGIDRERYLAAGYQLLYLFRGRSDPKPRQLTVTNLSEAEIAGHIANGYAYGCVRR